jgi:tetratricopeptide (TPR) repeat protein
MRGELVCRTDADRTEEVLLPPAQTQGIEDGAEETTCVRPTNVQDAPEDDQAALDEYVRAWARADVDPQAVAVLLREEVLLKTYPRSVEQLAPLVAQKQEVSAWRLLARVCEAEGDYDRAITLLTEAIRTYPEDVASLSILARVYAKRYGEAAAVKWHQRVLDVNPRVRASRFFLARWYYAQGQYAEALPHWECLFSRERYNRVCELYWLLTKVHCDGVQGLEKHLAAVQSWQELTTEERSLVHELFTLVGKLRLQAGELHLAEHALLHASRLIPSAEGATLLAEVRQRKKERARGSSQPKAVLNKRQQARNDLDTFIVSWAMSLYEEDRRRRLTVMKRLGGVVVLLLLSAGALWSYRQFQPLWPSRAFWEQLAVFRQGEQGVASAKKLPPPSSPLAKEDRSGGRRQGQGMLAALPAYSEKPPQEKVVASIELEMQVSGKGANDPQRSSQVIRQTVEAYLPGLRDVYAQARATDPLLLGSLVLDLTIEASGQVTRARVLSAKLDNRALWDSVLTQVRAWRFPQATGAVRVSFPLFFVPAEVDVASIITWEKYTALSKTEREKLSAAKGTPGGGPGLQEKQAVQQPRVDGQKLVDMSPSGIYRVTTPSLLRDQPRADAQVLMVLQPPMEVTVVGVRGDYLEVRAVGGKPASGYVYWGDVALVYKDG